MLASAISKASGHEASVAATSEDEAACKEAAEEAREIHEAHTYRASPHTLCGTAAVTLTSTEGKVSIAVTYLEGKGYIGNHAEMETTFTALSLNGLRRQIEAAMAPEQPIVTFNLDQAARFERDQRRAAARSGGR